MSIRRRLNRTVTHRREVDADDGAGGTVSTWITVDTPRVRIPQSSTTERLHGDQAQAEHTQPVYFLPGYDVRKDDELKHADGRVWRVAAVLHPSKTKYTRADCELIERRGT